MDNIKTLWGIINLLTSNILPAENKAQKKSKLTVKKYLKNNGQKIFEK